MSPAYYETIHTDKLVGPGITKLADDPGYASRVTGMVLSADAGCRVQFASGTDILATFFLGTGVPCVLPYNEEGWFIFPTGGDINMSVVGPGSPNVSIVAVWIREE